MCIANEQAKSLAKWPHKKRLSSRSPRWHHPLVAENKLATVSFRTQEELKASFEASLDALGSYGTATAFFEDCMRAVVHHARRGEKIVVPVTFEQAGNAGNAP